MGFLRWYCTQLACYLKGYARCYLALNSKRLSPVGLKCQLFRNIIFVIYLFKTFSLTRFEINQLLYTAIKLPAERHTLIGTCMISPFRRSICYLSKSLKASTWQIEMSSDISQSFYSIMRNGVFLKHVFYLILDVSTVKFFTEIFNP